MQNSLTIVILAAGKGKRMNNPDLPKVLVELDGKPFIEYVVELSFKLAPSQIIIIVGHHKEKVINFIQNRFGSSNHKTTKLLFAEQLEQLGTGHAVQQAENLIDPHIAQVMILSGDVPLLSFETLSRFITLHNENHSDLSVLTSLANNPNGYGRIVRDPNGKFIKIVEEKDANDQEKQINEINSGIYIVDKKLLFQSLKFVKNQNAQKEYYLTDIIGILSNQNYNVNAFCIANFGEIQGVNSPQDLENLIKIKKGDKSYDQIN